MTIGAEVAGPEEALVAVVAPSGIAFDEPKGWQGT